MKKFNGSILTLFAILFTTATTNAWEWPWKIQQARYRSEAGEIKILTIKKDDDLYDHHPFLLFVL
jgi:hypothetical protein